MENIPPFYVGQRVVCVSAKSNGQVVYKVSSVLKKGNHYTVFSIRYKCCGWEIDIGLKTEAGLALCICGQHYKDDSNIWWFSAKRFAPIHENFQSITLEKVLEQETKLISVN